MRWSARTHGEELGKLLVVLCAALVEPLRVERVAKTHRLDLALNVRRELRGGHVEPLGACRTRVPLRQSSKGWSARAPPPRFRHDRATHRLALLLAELRPRSLAPPVADCAALNRAGEVLGERDGPSGGGRLGFALGAHVRRSVEGRLRGRCFQMHRAHERRRKRRAGR